MKRISNDEYYKLLRIALLKQNSCDTKYLSYYEIKVLIFLGTDHQEELVEEWLDFLVDEIKRKCDEDC